MRLVRQAVVHGHPRGPRQLLDVLLPEPAELDRVIHPPEDAGGVPDRFLVADLRSRRVQIGDVGSLVVGRHLEGAAGARRGLLEDQADVLAGQPLTLRPDGLLALQVAGEVEEEIGSPGGEVRELEEAAVSERRSHGAGGGHGDDGSRVHRPTQTARRQPVWPPGRRAARDRPGARSPPAAPRSCERARPLPLSRRRGRDPAAKGHGRAPGRGPSRTPHGPPLGAREPSRISPSSSRGGLTTTGGPNSTLSDSSIRAASRARSTAFAESPDASNERASI